MRLSAALSFLLATETAFAFSVVPRIGFRGITKANPAVGKLYGLLDEIQGDDYNLMGATNESTSGINDVYETLLAELVFSTNDPREDIMNNYQESTGEAFLTWMKNKGENSKDPEERAAMRDLYEMIVDVKKRVELSKLAQEREEKEAEEKEQERMQQAETEADEGRQMSNTDVLRKAAAIGSAKAGGAAAPEKKKTFYEQDLTPEIRMSYEDTLKELLPPYKAGESPETAVAANYEKFDAQFVKVLTERVANGDNDSATLLDALSVEQSKRITVATDTLKGVLALGEPQKMEGALVVLAREGKIDESFLLLLEANENQARAAGATGPAEIMKRLRNRAADEKDKQVSSKEIRLIRKLLRADDSSVREKILEDAFTPKENLLVSGSTENLNAALDEFGELPEQQQAMPDVPPPDFINACKAVMLNFGNLKYDDERGDLASRIKQIAAEAEVVATKIYGQGMTTREQQDRAWAQTTTSIFDLEQMELEAEAGGEHAPWTNPDAPDEMFLPGFDSQGKMKIGGEQ